jgi:hypothetical protein
LRYPQVNTEDHEGEACMNYWIAMLVFALVGCAPSLDHDADLLPYSDESRLVWVANSEQFGQVTFETVKAFDARYQSAYIQQNSDRRGLRTFKITGVNIVKDEIQVLFQVQEERRAVLYVKDTTVGGTDRERWRPFVQKLEDMLVGHSTPNSSVPC